MNHTLKTIVDPSGKRRLLIVRRPDGLFSFEEQELVVAYDVELAEQLQDYRTCWVPVGHDLTICDTQEAAEREGRGAAAWLTEI
jgi:hypothetical protein